MRFRSHMYCLAALALSLAASVASVSAKDVILTNESAGRFLGSLAEMHILAASQGFDAKKDMKDPSKPFMGLLKAVKSGKAQEQATAIATKHGFGSVQNWLDTGRALAQAYLYVSAGSMRGTAKATLDKHKDTAARELDKLGLLTDKQKRKLQANLDAAGDELSKEPPKENVAVIQTIKPMIEAAVKSLKG